MGFSTFSDNLTKFQLSYFRLSESSFPHRPLRWITIFWGRHIFLITDPIWVKLIRFRQKYPHEVHIRFHQYTFTRMHQMRKRIKKLLLVICDNLVSFFFIEERAYALRKISSCWGRLDIPSKTGQLCGAECGRENSLWSKYSALNFIKIDSVVWEIMWPQLG